MSASAKSLRVERIKIEAAKAYLESHHPLGMGRECKFALGVIWEMRLQGVLTIGAPIAISSGTVLGLRQHELFELRKMHLSDACPPNSESRVLAILARIVRKQYPMIAAIITYCDGDEKATAYRAAGWTPMNANRYVRDVKVGGKWLTVRNANRLGVVSQATEKNYEFRRKWALPLRSDVAEQIKNNVIRNVEKT